MSLLNQARKGDQFEIDQVYAEIQKTIANMGTVPNTVLLQNNANKILNTIMNSKPQVLDNRMLEQGMYTDVQFFVDELQKSKYDESNVDKMKSLTKEMEDRSKQMAVLQTLDSLWSLPLTFEETIKEQNKALDEQLSMQLLQDNFIKMGPGYVRSAVDKMGNPSYQVLPIFSPYLYIKPDKLPTVKDSNGKEWDLTDYQALQGKGGPASAELTMMVRLARNQMQTDFKLTYDPEKSENREVGYTMLDPKAMAKVARAAQSALGQLASDPQKMFEFNSADAKGREAMIESAKNSGYLVGPTVGGAFGTHHFNQYYPILKMKEKYNEIKAEGEALNGNGFANAVGGVVSVATGGLINAKTAAKFMNDNGDVIDTITTVAAIVAAPFTGGASLLALAAYKAVKGAYEGGVLGAITGAASAYSSITGVDVSYSYDEGFGANLGVKVGVVNVGMSYSESGGFGASASVKLGGFSAGVSYTQNGGFGANVGYEFGGKTDMLKGLGMNLNYSQSGGFGGGISYSKTTGGGTKVTGGLNYSKDAGVGASLNAQREVSSNDNYTTTVTGGVSYSQKQGFGASVDASIEKVAQAATPGQEPPKPQFQSFSQMDMGLSFNQKEGFSASLGFDGVNALSYNQNTGLSGNTNFGVDLRKKYIQDEIDEEVKLKKEAAAEKEAEVLQAIAKENGWEGLPPEEIARRQKQKILDDPSAEKGGSRHGVLANVIGDIVDDVKTSLGYVSSDLVEQVGGKFRVRTCFVAGTLVTKLKPEYYAVANQLEPNSKYEEQVAIESIVVSDWVLSKNDETGETAYQRVANTFIRTTDAIYKVSLADGTKLETTWNHPFRVKKQGHALEKFSIETTDWVQAKDLHPGDVALRADGQELVITDITIDERVETVYNFEVEDYHTYFVGEAGVWVHNQSCSGAGSGGTYDSKTSHDNKNDRDYLNPDSKRLIIKIEENQKFLSDHNQYLSEQELIKNGASHEEISKNRKDYVAEKFKRFPVSESVRLIKNGRINESDLWRIIPKNAKNEFYPNPERSKEGYKFNLSNDNGGKIIVKWHSPDPGSKGGSKSNSANHWTAQIQIGNKYLTDDGKFTRNPYNDKTHIIVNRGH